MPHPREAQGIPRAVESGWYKLFQSKSSERVACAIATKAYCTVDEIDVGLRNEGHGQTSATNPLGQLGRAGVVEKIEGVYQVTPAGADLLLDHLPYKHARVSRAFIGLGLDRDEAERLLTEGIVTPRSPQIITGHQEETLLGLAMITGSEEGSTAEEIADVTGLAGPTTQNHLASFRLEGLVDATQTGTGKAHKAYSYRYNDTGRQQTIAYFLPEAQVFASSIGALLDKME